MEPQKPQIRGKDLAGAIKVMPMGMGDAIKKRVSGEFKVEQRGATVSFSTAEQSCLSSSVTRESRHLQSCQEEREEVRPIGTPFQQAGFQAVTGRGGQEEQLADIWSNSKLSATPQGSTMQASSSMKSQSQSSSFGQSSTQQMSSSTSQKSMMTSSTSQKSMMTSSSSSSKSLQSSSTLQQEASEVASQQVSSQREVASQQVSNVSFQRETEREPGHEEIGQEQLKTQLVSCISDLERDRDFVDFNKENEPITLASPPQTSPTPTFSPKQVSFSPQPGHKLDMFSPPPLEAIQPLATLPARQNGFAEHSATKKVEQEFQSSSSRSFQHTTENFAQIQSLQQVMNGTFEESSSAASSSSSLLQKIMTPAVPEYDSGSLKRRDPRKMFTDSSFYSAKHHPTVADQVELAHKLSSAMFNDKNKSTKGQQMFLSRVENAGGGGDHPAGHDRVPNLKHVMNPEGRMVEWGDLAQDELPNTELLANHALPDMNTPDPIAESLNAEAGKGGELFAKRRKRADNWVVDDSSVGKAKPSAFADQFMQEQTQRQSQFAQEQFDAKQQKQFLEEKQLRIQQTESHQQQSLAKQQFSQQSQQKLQQTDDLRRQAAEEKLRQENMAALDYPDNFQHTSLKARSSTPALDLSCHNVQGINVWANTAPRGWGGAASKPLGLPQGPRQQQALPELAVCPATPSLELEQQQLRAEQERLEQQQQEELVRRQQEKMMFQEQEMQQQQQQELQWQEEEERLEMQRVQQEYEQLQREKEMEQQMEMQRVQEQEQMEMQREMQMQQHQEMEQQRLMEQQHMEGQRQQEMQMQQMEQQRQMEQQKQMEQQRQMEQQQHMEQQRQMELQQQQEMQMRQQESLQQQQQMSSSSTTTTTRGMAEQQSFQAQESSSQATSFSQSSSSQQSSQVFVATELSGASRGYQAKGQDETGRRSQSAAAREAGLFGGIGADDNSLVENEFDYKKHSVKDLAHHFALVKPKAEISMTILPEQRLHNGQQGPALNYLGGRQDFAAQQQVFTKKEVSNEDIEASKKAYEMKKKMQMEQNSSSSTTTTSSSSVVMREKRTEELKKDAVDQRRASLSSALLMDPAAAHAQAGIIDPSAILRGEDGTNHRHSCALRASVPGELELCASKWDNHNGIARGWGGLSVNYKPVTFRRIYNVDSQGERIQNL